MNNSDCIDVNSSEDGDQCNGHDFVVENYFVETVMQQRQLVLANGLHLAFVVSH